MCLSYDKEIDHNKCMKINVVMLFLLNRRTLSDINNKKLINYFEGIFRGSGIIVPLCFVFLIAYSGPERRLNGKEVLGGFEVV